MKKLLVILALVMLCSALCVSQTTAGAAKKPAQKSAPCSQQISKAFKQEALLTKVAIDQLKGQLEQNSQSYTQYDKAAVAAMAKVAAEDSGSSVCEGTVHVDLLRYYSAVAGQRIQILSRNRNSPSGSIDSSQLHKASACIAARLNGDDSKCQH